MRNNTLIRLFLITTLTCVASAGAAGWTSHWGVNDACAQDGAQKDPSDEDLEKAKAAYIEGKKLIDEKNDLAGGVAKFKLSYRLSRNPLLLYNIGLALDQLKQSRLALFYYKKFLAASPVGAQNRDEAEKRVAVLVKAPPPADDAFGAESTNNDTTAPKDDKDTKDTGATKIHKDASAKENSPTAEKDDAQSRPPRTPEPVTEFKHKLVEEAPPSRPLDVSAFVPESARWQVNLYYREQGKSTFVTIAMRPRYNELVGRIPPTAMHGTTLQYYIEARDSSGKIVARSGRATSPNLVFIDESAKPRFYPDLGNAGAGDPFAAGTGTSAGSGSNRGGGPVDFQRDNLALAKWGATGGAATFLTMAVSFYFVAANANSDLEALSFTSNSEGCAMGPPCQSFSSEQKSLQDRGQRFETLTNVFMSVGLLSAGAAGYLWYRDAQRRKEITPSSKTSQHSRTAADGAKGIVAVPIVGRGFVGASAAVRF